jgi:glucose-6-phosphate isomerase
MDLNFTGLGKHDKAFRETLDLLAGGRVAERIWGKDYTLWASDPTEITDRLGWLDVMDSMRGVVLELVGFSERIRRDGISDVVLLGMGGSSLGAEVLNQAFGRQPGYPRLTVLDSIIPEAVNSVREASEPGNTLLLVSSKSGTTAETRALFDYFYAFASDGSGGNAGPHFAAITDPGSLLEDLAREHGFRHVFLNPPDIGGRYSVLSYYGLVPAAALGIDIDGLLSTADAMRKRCGPLVRCDQNDGCRLGAYFGGMAKQGMDKVTLLTSPALGGFGLWAEQLIAESTGKNGKGLVPVAGEPSADASVYGDDRTFVYVRLEGDDNSAIDSLIEKIKSSGHPVAKIQIKDRLELAGLFYLCEFAVAVAGSIIGIHPFDQPDVQRSKDATRRLLKQYADSGKLPAVETEKSISALLSEANQGDYFAIMAYIRETSETNLIFCEIRRKVMEKHKLATTLGYGPRFLHSTGQLHKGGPNKGLFLQIVSDAYLEMPIPGRPYSFSVMSQAESMGDLEALQKSGRRVIRLELNPAHLREALDI